jgi:hypothetical protein
VKIRDENIKRGNIDSFLLIVILSLGLLIWHNSQKIPERTDHYFTSEFSVSNTDAILTSGINITSLQTTIIFQKESFIKLCNTIGQLLENRKTEQKISLLNDERINTDNTSAIFCLYHVFPSEKDDLPPLG